MGNQDIIQERGLPLQKDAEIPKSSLEHRFSMHFQQVNHILFPPSSSAWHRPLPQPLLPADLL